MTVQTWLAFAAASAVLLVIPGPTILTVIAYSVSHKGRARLPLVAAVALGDSTALVLSLVGLGALLAASALAFSAIKIAGGLYLIYLGVKMLRSGIVPAAGPAAELHVSRRRLFLNTYTVTALNPKGIIFFVAFLPQFLHSEGNVTLQLWILGSTFVGLAIVNATLYAVFAASARRMLSHGGAQRLFNGVGGGLLTAAGVWALFARRVTAAV
ncbi:MAG TPA: LysE family translocator [Casimicrobiaceae bacterium]|nr:LysE family translocator [Casimicrobiaceae bacterium]